MENTDNDGTTTNNTTRDRTRTLVPVKVGEAMVYIEASPFIPRVEPSDAIYAVSMPGPEEAFETAMDAIKQCITFIGSHLSQIQDGLRPDELTIEFSVELEATGKGRIIPVLFTAEAKASAGLKVEAKWVLATKK